MTEQRCSLAWADSERFWPRAQVLRHGACDPGIKTCLDVSENQTHTRVGGDSPLDFQAPAGRPSIFLMPLACQVSATGISQEPGPAALAVMGKSQ